MESARSHPLFACSHWVPLEMIPRTSGNKQKPKKGKQSPTEHLLENNVKIPHLLCTSNYSSTVWLQRSVFLLLKKFLPYFFYRGNSLCEWTHPKYISANCIGTRLVTHWTAWIGPHSWNPWEPTHTESTAGAQFCHLKTLKVLSNSVLFLSTPSTIFQMERNWILHVYTTALCWSQKHLLKRKKGKKKLLCGQKILSEITDFAKIPSVQHYLILCKEESSRSVPNSI